MYRRAANWYGIVATLLAFAVLAGDRYNFGAGPQQDKFEPPKPLPPELVAAWKQAGAKVGYLRVSEFGSLEFLTDRGGIPGDVPAFEFKTWKEGVSAKLPAPAVPFGLNLRDS